MIVHSSNLVSIILTFLGGSSSEIMDKFLIRKSTMVQDSSSTQDSCVDSHAHKSSKRIRLELNNIPSDLALQPKILPYHPNDKDEIRRAYIQKGSCQPFPHNFPQRDISGLMCRFNPAWFKEYKNWLEYSQEKDEAFCLCCYLFRPDFGKRSGGDAFVTDGFRIWNKKEKLQIHVGGVNSAHNQAAKKCEDLMKPEQHIQNVFVKQSNQDKIEHRTHLNATVDVTRFLLR